MHLERKEACQCRKRQAVLSVSSFTELGVLQDKSFRGQSRGQGGHTQAKKKKLGPLVAHGNTFIENLGNPADKGDGNGGGLPGASLHLPLGAGRQVGAVLVWGSP